MTFQPLYRHFPRGRWSNGDLAAKVGVDLGIAPDDEQRALLDAIYAESAPGRPVAFEVAVVGPRQNIKTSTLGVAALADMYVFGVAKHLWSAHLDDTAKNTFVDFKAWITSNPDYESRTQFYEGHQDRSIVDLETGNRIDFGSRTGKIKRGVTGVERVTLDEALYLQEGHMGAVYPTMLTKPGAQVRVASSAGLEVSEPLRRIRDRGRSGKDPRLAYVEYGAVLKPCADEKCLHTVGSPGCSYDDREAWWQSNCALWCGRISESSLEDQRNSLPPQEWAREFLSQWEDPPSLGGAISPTAWESCRFDGMPQPDGLVIGLAGTRDGLYAGIGAAGVLDDGRVGVAPIERRRGQVWLVDEVKRIQGEHGSVVIVDGGGPLKYLLPAFDEAGVDVVAVELSQWVDASAGLWQGIENRTVAHPGDKDLTASALAAPWRKIGDRRAFDRRTDIVLLEGCALAAWQAVKDTTSYDVLRSVY